MFEYLDRAHQHRLLHALGQKEVASILEEMSADDRTAALAELPTTIQKQLLAELSPEEREIARTLLGYPKGSVGRLMTPDYLALSESFSVAQALAYIREHGEDSDTVNVVYVVKETGELVGGLRIRSLIMSEPEKPLAELLSAESPQLFAGDQIGVAAETFRSTDLYALPVVNSSGKILGIVTADDVLEAAQQAATREVQKIGGSAALGVPYLVTTVLVMLWKRAPWLIVLFVGGMFTANAMVHYETQVEKAVVLAVFLPLIIASGGNSGSQSAALVIRALGLGELRLRDWWRVLRREIVTGLGLGAFVGVAGLLRVILGSALGEDMTPYWIRVGVTVGCSLAGVVLWGSLVGAMLPFILRKDGLDPALSSTPFVATCFSVATVMLQGALL